MWGSLRGATTPYSHVAPASGRSPSIIEHLLDVPPGRRRRHHSGQPRAARPPARRAVGRGGNGRGVPQTGARMTPGTGRRVLRSIGGRAPPDPVDSRGHRLDDGGTQGEAGTELRLPGIELAMAPLRQRRVVLRVSGVQAARFVDLRGGVRAEVRLVSGLPVAAASALPLDSLAVPASHAVVGSDV